MNSPTTITNPAWTAASRSPRLSVLVPYYLFDCGRLLTTLLQQASKLSDPIEILLADDGGKDTALNTRLAQLIEHADTPIQWQIFTGNLGRAAIRNCLLQHARAAHVLFLDCDMLPDHDDFLARYLQAITEAPETLAFVGGRSYQQLQEITPEQRLYHYFSRRTECLPASQRQQHAAWYLFTNNLVVKRSALIEQPFDDTFTGWGFEDTDWGLRVADMGRIQHLDNPATHLGLMSDQALLDKYRESLDNYQHMLKKHPAATRAFPVSRLATRLSAWPGIAHGLNRSCAYLVTLRSLPLRLRFAALQLFRASLYAQALSHRH